MGEGQSQSCPNVRGTMRPGTSPRCCATHTRSCCSTLGGATLERTLPFLQCSATRYSSLAALAAVALVVLCATPAAASSRIIPGGYADGDEVLVECRNLTTGAWEPGPICHETGTRFSVFVGVDSFRYCALQVTSDGLFEGLRGLVNQSLSWQCRVPVIHPQFLHGNASGALRGERAHLKGAQKGHIGSKPGYIPFSIQYIGEDEGDALRLNTRMNFVFHLHKGEIVGAAAYPILDRLQYVKVGSLASMHGSVVWLRHVSLRASAISKLTGHHGGSRGDISLGVNWALTSAAAAAVVTFTLCLALYLFVLRPSVIRECLKKD